ncbi:hypothetical protein ACFL1E_00890 [Candidatus Omnitrophota bacterium]
MEKKLRYYILNLFVIALFFSSLVYAATPQTICAVIFGITIGEKGELLDVRISKVIDASSGSTDAIEVEIPDTYFANAKAKIENHGYEPALENGRPKEFFTYFYYDANRPDVVIDDTKLIESKVVPIRGSNLKKEER